MKQLRTAILSGDLDDHESEVTALFRERRRVRAIEMKSALSVGDTVRIEGIRPKYINGLHAVVREVLETRAAVEIIDEHKPHARKYGFGPVRVPIDHLEPLRTS